MRKLVLGGSSAGKLISSDNRVIATVMQEDLYDLTRYMADPKEVMQMTRSVEHYQRAAGSYLSRSGCSVELPFWLPHGSHFRCIGEELEFIFKELSGVYEKWHRIPEHIRESLEGAFCK